MMYFLQSWAIYFVAAVIPYLAMSFIHFSFFWPLGLQSWTPIERGLLLVWWVLISEGIAMLLRLRFNL